MRKHDNNITSRGKCSLKIFFLNKLAPSNKFPGNATEQNY